MKHFIAAVLFALSTSATAQTLVENNQYKEIYLNFDDAQEVSVTVQGERYRATRPHTLITIKEVTDGLFVVDQENLYYPAIAVYPPLPMKTLRDSANIVIEKGDRWAVRLLVPAKLEVIATEFKVVNPGAPICLAYWTGFMYNEETDSCDQVGMSGCGNPFEFTTLDACETANLLK